MVVIMVLCPCHGKVWCGAIVLAVAALLAWLWFTSCPMRRELVVAFVIVSRPSGGVSMGVDRRSLVVGCPAGREADDHDPEPRGRGPCWLDRP